LHCQCKVSLQMHRIYSADEDGTDEVNGGGRTSRIPASANVSTCPLWVYSVIFPLRLNRCCNYVLCLSYHFNTEAVLLACLSSGWATTTGRLLGPKVGNSIMYLSQGHSDTLPHRESNLQCRDRQILLLFDHVVLFPKCVHQIWNKLSTLNGTAELWSGHRNCFLPPMIDQQRFLEPPVTIYNQAKG